MYISELKLWNFRKFGKKDEWDLANPHLIVPFISGTNVLIGENDSGKTAIVDAVKLVLKTHSYEWIRIEEDDFFGNSDKLRIELMFDGLKDEEAKHFTEWLGWKCKGKEAKPILRLILFVERKNNRILPYDVKAGMDAIGYPLHAEAKEYLKLTYLKALRDADGELVAKKNSRLSQILQVHDLFKKTDDNPHEFEKMFGIVNESIKEWFEKETKNENKKSNKEQIKDVIDSFLIAFIGDSKASTLELTKPEIKAILEKISLGLKDEKNLGLGTMNRLYMATELLHLKKEYDGLKVGLVEELEAHLHPQAQMKVIAALQKEFGVQFILTTHSPNLASKLQLHNLILCNGDDVYPLGEEVTLEGKGTTIDKYTKLNKKDYKYLERFLDVTKSNLFFAKGVIIVEGWAEEILIPAIAKKIGCDLTSHEVSIVNVGSTAYLHFAKIFLRNDDKILKIPVSVVTDLDVPPGDNALFDAIKENEKRKNIETNFKDYKNTIVNLEIAKQWTLEWCLYKSPSLASAFKDSVSEVHYGTNEFQKDEKGIKPEFETKLIAKLAKKQGESPIDKVAIAGVLAEKISTNNDLKISQDDEFLEYLIKSIRHACRVK